MFWLKKLDKVEDDLDLEEVEEDVYYDSSNSSMTSESMASEAILRCWKRLAQKLPVRLLLLY